MGYEVSGVSVCGSRYRADFRWRNEDGSLSPRIRRMLSGTDRESAVEEAEWMALHDLSPISDGSISLGEAIEEYIASKEGEVSPLTAKGYRGSLGKMARASRRIVAMPLRELEPSHIRNYEDARLRKGVSPNTVRKEHSLIAAALDAAVASGGIRSNPAREVSPPPFFFEKRLRERAVP
ncbi:phage integrase SAM-like domain-containing protein [Gordonibacter sp. RACS_AR49]|uniref:phage integrase SAM-like domain-containing protein n=1 Tax=Gordonibacter sp. RACS_AR49 TaxID=2871986 RepID=UPI0026290CAD|nr:phage integrase SAM-like domain-containing protein [Gordonibacter sp. RACS_AR49]MDN4508723.1 phage integrase SAM-like domain-containing protein [Gordonibacter sp. RACS_AR49]